MQSLGQLFEEDEEDLSKEDILNSLLIAIAGSRRGQSSSDRRTLGWY
ncbi:MAG: hypothetical protein JGK24_12350 [Microcoleus sp. PH2017_29_MFU_D_A]|nr:MULTISPECIES: hypothetical protein [unclassified Microcoleus]MCC3418686.1 hypothetical protein [Microcoleus sp. PH2017_07_MST_O_A]MCC3430555.1 hypothetical protein [Microcoleus sp. PH2017_04_SCI_O_A]MCC3443752.1 hypothetical protein [Microcoleus sp. PH2017_03_ELD_O_A]MCC3464937.1 hypothetical protein [Microcoleus sp. PH2017_06_SFM_O_A]MCC3505073.1 hypothetical protein [Microcoleus sp. PH2017_19_SFW_U_A]MCC3509226.1 hypothetical protein [Microcoleus sp. PH2017_17_BER_D_A]